VDNTVEIIPPRRDAQGDGFAEHLPQTRAAASRETGARFWNLPAKARQRRSDA
jgi:hypothetical protein